MQSTDLAPSPDQVAIRTIDDAARDKSRFLAWLDANHNTPERLAQQLAQLKTHPDARLRFKAVELETRIRGFFADEDTKGVVAIQINVGQPQVREPKVIQIDSIEKPELKP